MKMRMNLHVAASLLAISGTAAAQSNVTLFGVMDLGLREVRNEGRGSIKSMTNGNFSTSRLGVRGIEDLGNGLSAGFWLESTVLADTGSANTQFWDRRSTVSLISRSLGEVRLGRDYVGTFITWVEQDPFGNIGVGNGGQFTGPGVRTVRDAFGATGLRTDVRSNNTVQYFLPADLGGVYGSAMVAPGEGGTAAGGGRLNGLRLGYRFGKLDTSVAALDTKTDAAGNPSIKDIAAGISYDFGFLRLSGAYRQFKYLASKQTNYLIGVIVPIGQHQIKAAYVDGNGQGTAVGGINNNPNDGSKVALGYAYHLSKRTGLYAHVAQVSNKGASNNVIPGGPTSVAGRKSSGYEFGIRHAF